MVNKSPQFDEDFLGDILGVPNGGIWSAIQKTYNVEFMKECSKIPNTRRVGVLKKLKKDEYQLVFEFVKSCSSI